MTDKFEAAIDRLEGLADRIEERIDTAASSGKDVTRARSELEAARLKIKEASSELENAKSKYAQALKNTDVKAAFAEVKKIVQGVAAKVKDAHGALARVASGLKGVGGPRTAQPAEATTSQPSQ
jgi:seryl-tRNA synthetase